MVEMSQLIKLVNSDKENDWSAALVDVAKSLGFDSVMFAAVPSKHASVESSFVHSNYSEEWRRHYLQQKLYEVDPTVHHSKTSVLPLVWEPHTFTQRDEHAMYEEASGFGIRSGITFPVHGCNGETGLISFASDTLPDESFSDHLVHYMADLSLVRDYAFQSSLQFVRGRIPAEPVPHLTKRELEVIKWVMAGKSSWEISRITNCAEATINFHISNIRQKFNVNTRQQALVKAIALGIITPEDPHR
ncbi:MAG: LuxR family transcriptional regulator [Pseudomonadota bacterium]